MTWWPAEQATKALEESGRMTTSLAPGQPAKTARTRAGGGVDDADGVAAAIGDHQRLAIGRRRARRRLFAGADLRRFRGAPSDRRRRWVRAGVGDVGQLAVGIEIDGDRLAVHGNGGDDGVVLGVDHRNGALAGGRAGVDDVDFVARGAGGDGDGILADGQFAIDADVDHVETVTVPLPPLVT